jgi:hypothetical protein
MADDLGRVNPVLPHFLDRGSREEPYHGRHGKKHQAHRQHSSDEDVDDFPEEDAGESGAHLHIDLRV